MKTPMVSMIFCATVAAGCETSGDGAAPVAVDRHVADLETSPVPEEANHEAAAWAKLGVARVQTVAAPEGVAHRALLFDAAGKEVGSLEVSALEGGGRRVVTRVAGHHARIDLGEVGTLRIADLTTGREGVARFDLEAKRWTPDPMIETLQAELGDIIPLAMGTLNAVDMQQRSDAAEEVEVNGPSPFDAVEPAIDGLWGCYGSWHRGGAYWGTRSGCCVIARRDAAQRCSNSSCYGCCDYRSCDSWCSRGDYFCVCGISGRACS